VTWRPSRLRAAGGCEDRHSVLVLCVEQGFATAMDVEAESTQHRPDKRKRGQVSGAALLEGTMTVAIWVPRPI
jgi:hypothetical protein